MDTEKVEAYFREIAERPFHPSTRVGFEIDPDKIDRGGNFRKRFDRPVYRIHREDTGENFSKKLTPEDEERLESPLAEQIGIQTYLRSIGR